MHSKANLVYLRVAMCSRLNQFRYFICVLPLLFSFPANKGQQLNLKHFTEDAGLITSGIKQIEIDHLNNLFLVTNHNHLWTYNGKEFREYPLETKSDINLYLSKDNLGVLWLVHENYGVHKITIQKLEIQEFPEITRFTYTTPGVFYDLDEICVYRSLDRTFVFLHSQDSLHFCELSENLFSRKTSLVLPRTSQLNACRKGVLIKSNSKTSILTTDKTGNLINQPLISEWQEISSSKDLNYYYVFSKNSLILLTNNYSEHEKFTFGSTMLPDLAAKHKALFTPSLIYIYGPSGVFSINRETKVIQTLSKGIGFLTNTVNDLTIDLQGNIWFAHDLGLTKLPNITALKYSVFESSIDKEVSCLAWFNQDKHLLFIGSNYQMMILDWATKEVLFKHTIKQDNLIKNNYQGYPRILDAVKANESIYYIWKKVGIFRLHMVNGHFIEQAIKIKDFQYDIATSITCSSDNKTLYILSSNKLVVYSTLKEKEIRRFQLGDEHYIGRKIFAKNKDELIIFGVYGIWYLNLLTGESRLEEKSNSYFAYIKSKHEQSEFIAGAKGLFRINASGLSKVDLAISCTIYSIVEDDAGLIWLGTNEGVFVWNPKTNFLEELNNQSGLLGLETNRSAFLLANSLKKLIVGTNKGINFIDLNINTNIAKIPLYIEAFFVNGTKQNNSANKFKINSVLLFNLGYSSFNNSKTLKYCYRLNSSVQTWLEFSTSQIGLSELPPGKYKIDFVVRNGLSNLSNIVSYEFEILAPWYQSKVFIGFCILLLVCIIFILVLFRFKRIANKERSANFILNLRKQLLENKLASLRAQINPHFVNNLMNKIRFKLSSGKGKEATELITEYAHIMRYAFENTQNDFVCLEDELMFYTQYLKLEALVNSINYVIVKDNFTELNCKRLLVPSMLVQPIIENAGKHAFDSKNTHRLISIKVSELDTTHLLLQVIDNGKGFNEENVRLGASGLAVTKTRIMYYNELMLGNYSMTIKTKSGEGTVVEFILPKLIQ